MKPLFNEVKLKKIRRNAFDLSHEKKLSMDMGSLVPIYLQEVVPGDKFKVNTEVLVRFAPMLAPLMHRVNVFTHYFFVPNRLVYENWQSYITGGTQGTDNPTFPVMKINNANKNQWAFAGSLADFMGIPIGTYTDTYLDQYINGLPFRAYQLIWNEYYRDQTLQTPVTITKNDTFTDAETGAVLQLQKRCWEKDYYTSALPWTQRGGAVNIPNIVNPNAAGPTITFPGAASQGLSLQVGPNVSGNTFKIQDNSGPTIVSAMDPGITVDISLINLRRAARLQEWLEKNATGGSRYIEQILAHFGVKSSDSRLQRPQYLGGGKSPVVISEVVSMVKQTDNPQGTMAGHGISVGNHHGFDQFFEEHGYIIGIMSVLPRTAYQQGMPRMFSKVDRYDWFWPEFANIGEQAIMNKELFMNYTDSGTVNNAVFGYTPRYAEYKFNNSTVHGDFKTTLNFWHMGRIFSALPALNAAFVAADPTVRPFAVTDGTHLWVQLYNKVNAIRPMPVFGTPTL
nr:MAG: major capsid protein [Microviridae sp.]